ncbi:3-deoxy-D-manno-octulosonic acid transferase [Acetobacteroides hydrogenigenes]|uniref:3-deoxy-D-manno-octulosonic acid transferase n=1 Tax=Acetobacteroides hydrogenigenes TaxID=979970 RepID=A0A4R2EID0_9BACT|nr:glycosyltransferase N-terminal domain-containing protein [Acetobacteroides hydrogenigenes]TCN63919.1 3-deoxy-D-manno-octulosonic-acid transferase [Acetobacteroides hydrogenigenes]
MIILYSILLRIYFVLILIASISNDKAKKWISGRRSIFKRLRAQISDADDVIWFHCASLGEFEQGRPVIEAYKKQHPSSKILLTFFSPSGYEIRKNYEGADYIFYLPLDTYFNAKRFIQIVRPKAAVFVKYEFWYYYLQALHRNSIPTYVISAIFRPNQIFFRWYGGMFRRILRNYRQLFVQNQQSCDLLRSIGVTNVTISGDTRFDRVADIARNVKDLPIVGSFVGDNFALIAGSTWPDDETILAEYAAANPSLKMVVAPHEIGEGHIQDILAKFRALKTVRYTQASPEEAANAQILVVDTIGILSSVYRHGKVAYIGGGFGVGIHNTLEAATFGLPIVFGPNYHKFQEAKDLVGLKAAFSIENYVQFNDVMGLLTKNSQALHQSSKAAKEYVTSHIGATQTIIQGIM